MSEKTIAMALCNSTWAGLLFAILLTINPNFCGAFPMEGLDISRDDNTTVPVITIPQGTIQGVNMVSRLNRTFYGFMGVPYAEPPVRDLRFRPPVPAKGWNGIFDASNGSTICSQYVGFVLGEEDCLNLNLYTPQLPTNDSSTLVPVLVYILGGGFTGGVPGPSQIGPYFLLDKDVLFVVPSFRHGPLGYLTTGDEASPGNYGLKDIVCALQWVQKNIRYFGGDPERVTLAGGSSGSMSVNLLTLSKSTEGLFHNYITESGSALSMDFSRPREVYVNRAIKLGEHFGCPTNTSTLLVNCLREVDVSQLLDTNSLFYEWKTFPGSIWRPTYEPDSDGAIFTDYPANYYASGNIRDLPWISLVTRDEGLTFTIGYYVNPDEFEDFLENIDMILPYFLGYKDVVDDVTAYTTALKSYYLNDLTANRTLLLTNLTQLASDAAFIYPAYSAFKQHLLHAKSPQYFTSFQYRGIFSHTYTDSGGLTGFTGVSHGDEIIYLYGHQEDRLGPADAEYSETDLFMVDTMVQLWTSFATNGKPTTDDSISTTVWEPYSSRNNYLRIGNQYDPALEMSYDLNLERMQFWDKLTKSTTTSGAPDK